MSLRSSVVAGVLATFLVLSGCLSQGDPLADLPIDDDVAPTMKPFVNPIDLEHDHGDPTLHDIANNIEPVGRDPITENGPPGGLGEIDIAGNYAYVAVFGLGFAIVDLSDPANPTTVGIGEIPTPDTVPVTGTGLVAHYTADIKVDATGDWVFLALELSYTPGLMIFDARDKANPTYAGFWAAPGLLLGCHMIEYAVIDGLEYLFCAPLDNAIWIGLLLPPTPTGQREIVQVGRYVPYTPKYVEEVSAAGANAPLEQVSGHQDMTFQLDPLDGTPMLFVSFWSLGVRFLDVSIPAAPIEVGSWDGEDSEWYRGLIHTAMAFESEGRRIVVAIPEVAVPPAVFVLDATDFSNPILLSEWRALDDFQGQDTSFSTHNFQIVGGKVYLQMYHGGLWILDVSTPEKQAAPEPVGSYYNHEPRADGEPYWVDSWDVVVWNGYTITADGNGGVYVLHFATDPAGDPTYTSFA